MDVIDPIKTHTRTPKQVSIVINNLFENKINHEFSFESDNEERERERDTTKILIYNERDYN